MAKVFLLRSFRSKLVAAALLVEVAMLGLLIHNSARQLEQSIVEQFALRVSELDQLFDAALAAPLAQQDYALLNDILDGMQRKEGINHLILHDQNQRVVAQSNQHASQHTHQHDHLTHQHGQQTRLPSLQELTGHDSDPRHIFQDNNDDHLYHRLIPINLGSQPVGWLHYGISTQQIHARHDQVMRDSMIIAAIELILSFILLTTTGIWLTRHLARLTRGADELAQGNLDVRVPVTSNDEVGQLTIAFNTMANALHNRIDDLEQSGTQQRQLTKQAEAERARLSALLSAMNLGILFIGEDDQIIYTNPAFQAIWRFPKPASLVGLSLWEALKHSGSELTWPHDLARHFLDSNQTKPTNTPFEIKLTDGRIITELNIPVHSADGGPIGRLLIYEDVTRDRQSAAQLLYHAERDNLTGLYNRNFLEQTMGHLLKEAERRSHSCALLFFDLDEFKAVNDSFGHQAGDTLLIRVARELSKTVRGGELLCRLGGDEFALLLPIAEATEAEQAADRIVQSIAKIPLQFDGQSIRMTASIGIALYPQHASGLQDMLAHADTAMYQAKQAGKNTWRIFEPSRQTTEQLISTLTWNDRISQALENDLLRLHFQGVYCATTLKLHHAEVLVRMLDPESGKLIMPSSFIPVAEKSGKILDIDRWVLLESVRRLGAEPNIPGLAVNISAHSFNDDRLPGHIADLLEKYQVDASRLLIELTETAAISDLADAEHFIGALHQLGCHVCLDDFGSGYASFAYLKHISAKVVKIDGLFIRNLAHDSANQAFVKAMVDIARSLDRQTVAECVEDEESLKLLSQFGIDQVQGYHLHRPSETFPT